MKNYLEFINESISKSFLDKTIFDKKNHEISVASDKYDSNYKNMYAQILKSNSWKENKFGNKFENSNNKNNNSSLITLVLSLLKEINVIQEPLENSKTGNCYNNSINKGDNIHLCLIVDEFLIRSFNKNTNFRKGELTIHAINKNNNIYTDVSLKGNLKYYDLGEYKGVLHSEDIAIEGWKRANSIQQVAEEYIKNNI